MKKAIALLGPPVSGKSTLTGLYPNKAIQIGEYAHSLSQDHPLKEKCIAHWQANTLFDQQLVTDLLQSMSIKEQEWYLLDGAPRNIGSVSGIEALFTVSALVEIQVDESIWMQRARQVAGEGRSERYDSSLAQLLKRKEVYDTEMTRLRPYFSQTHVIDNSRDIQATQQQFRKIISQLFPNSREVEAA